jgi:HAD superfamily hydrolase (TIGR01509 family)
MASRAILFDIDGTLIDSNYLHIEAWAKAFAALGVQVDAWRIHRSIGMDSAKLIEAVVPSDAAGLADSAKELHAKFYAELSPRLRPFRGAAELLRTLDARGFTVVLATSAPEDELEKLRAALEVEDAISVVTSAEDVQTAKPSPDIVQVALERSGVEPASAMMVGDTVWDVAAAGRAGVRCIGVMSGGISARELLDAGAVDVYTDVEELLDRIDDANF